MKTRKNSKNKPATTLPMLLFCHRVGNGVNVSTSSDRDELGAIIAENIQGDDRITFLEQLCKRWNAAASNPLAEPLRDLIGKASFVHGNRNGAQEVSERDWQEVNKSIRRARKALKDAK